MNKKNIRNIIIASCLLAQMSVHSVKVKLIKSEALYPNQTLQAKDELPKDLEYIKIQNGKSLELKNKITGEVKAVLKHSSWISSLIYNKKHNKLLVTTIDQNAYLYDQNGKLLVKIKHKDGFVVGGDFNTDGTISTITTDNLNYYYSKKQNYGHQEYLNTWKIIRESK